MRKTNFLSKKAGKWRLPDAFYVKIIATNTFSPKLPQKLRVASPLLHRLQQHVPTTVRAGWPQKLDKLLHPWPKIHLILSLRKNCRFRKKYSTKVRRAAGGNPTSTILLSILQLLRPLFAVLLKTKKVGLKIEKI